MKKIELTMPDIPHGHGLSFKKGIADGILGTKTHEKTCHNTHSASYNSGLVIGEKLKKEVASQVKE